MKGILDSVEGGRWNKGESESRYFCARADKKSGEWKGKGKGEA